jgi:transcriptional regulator with XRE-family HTH domain
MQVEAEVLSKWSEIKEKGDVQQLVKLTGLSRGTISNILSGKQETTTTKLMIIKKFFDQKVKIQKSINA